MDIIRIIGRQAMAFKGQDGNDVQGTQYYYLESDSRVEGQKAGKFFLTASRLMHVGYVPQVGDAVKVYYNRFGKPDMFELCEEDAF